MMSKTWKHFFRNGLACAIIWNSEGYHWGFIGVTKDHPLNGSTYHRSAGIGLHRSLMDSEFSFKNSALDNKYWMGFQSKSPMSFDKTLSDLKIIADSIDKEFNSDSNSSTGGFKLL